MKWFFYMSTVFFLVSVSSAQSDPSIGSQSNGAGGVNRVGNLMLITANDSGWYNNLGGHLESNENYLAGSCVTCPSSQFFRNFFVFDMSLLAEVHVLSAELRIWHPTDGYVSPDETEQVEFYEVSTPVSELVSGFGGVPAFVDLGSGTNMGNINLSLTDHGKTVTVPINAEGIVVLNSKIGGQFAIGGAVSTLSGAFVDELVFGFSDLATNVELVLVVGPAVPTLGSWFLWILLLAMGMFGLLAVRRRRVAILS